MISETVEPQRWPATRWWTLIGLVLGGQFFLIFWLGKPSSHAPRPGQPAPTLELTRLGANFDQWRWGGSPDSGSDNLQLMALADPTLLALPHTEGFSGPAWLIFSPQQFPASLWSEPTPWLELGERQLGSEFKDFMATNQFDPLPALQQQELVLKMPELQQPELLPAHSRLWLAGGLTNRRLLNPPELPHWPSADILTNSVVQLWVAADGTPASPILLKSRGSPNAADDYALREAAKMRFEPLTVSDPTDPMAGLTWGQIVFEWHTSPLPATNNPAEPVSPK